MTTLETIAGASIVVAFFWTVWVGKGAQENSERTKRLEQREAKVRAREVAVAIKEAKQAWPAYFKGAQRVGLN